MTKNKIRQSFRDTFAKHIRRYRNQPEYRKSAEIAIRYLRQTAKKYFGKVRIL